MVTSNAGAATARRLTQRVRTPCQVAGCQACKLGDPYTCEVCKARMYLVISSGTCECLPGHFGKASCKRCPKGRVSPGGRLPIPSCTTCPKRTPSNAEQSDCVDPKAWSHWGGDLNNRRWSQLETKLSTANAGNLTVKWEASVVGSTSATPTVHEGFVYVPDWEGHLYCLSAEKGSVVWSKEIKDYLTQLGVKSPSNLAVFPILSRTSPVVNKDSIIIGTMQRSFGGFAFWLSIKAADGSLVWGRQADPNIAAVITVSPTLYNGTLFTGISSLEENVASRQNYTCCTFRGSVVAVNADTGDLIWQTFTTPDNNGRPDLWSGAAVWGSSPVIDRARRQVVISTGDNYRMPEEVESCLLGLGDLTPDNSPQQRACLQLAGGMDNHHNAIMALDLGTGRIKWSTPVDGPDAWNAACLSDNPLVNDNCPAVEGPDFDFGQAPMLVTPCKPSKGCRQLLVVGQKSGIVWALDPSDGGIVWHQRAGPGGVIGGIMWGSASDNKFVFVNNNNHPHARLNLTSSDAYLKPVPNTPTATQPPATANGGLCTALDAWDGTVQWTFTNPATDQAGRNAWSLSPITVANGVVMYASMDTKGTLFMLRAADGKLLGQYELGASSACGPSVVNGTVFSGTGYSNFALGSEGTKVVALQVVV